MNLYLTITFFIFKCFYLTEAFSLSLASELLVFNDQKEVLICDFCMFKTVNKRIFKSHAKLHQNGLNQIFENYFYDSEKKIDDLDWDSDAFDIDTDLEEVNELEIKTKEDVDFLVREREYTCLSYLEKGNLSKKISMKCSNNHTWETDIYRLKRGSGCPSCRDSSSVPSIVLERLNKLAKKRGYTCLLKVEKYLNQSVKIPFKCPQKHKIFASIKNFRKPTFSCKKCTGKKFKLSLSDVHKIAKNRKLKFLSKKYKNNRIKYEWLCHKGHHWDCTVKDVQRSNCPECSSKPRKYKLKDLEALGNKPDFKFKFKSEEWKGALKKHSWECKSCNKDFESRIEYVKKQTFKCPHCGDHKNQSLTIKDIHVLAREKEGLFLSDTYKNNKTNYWWMCKAGHNFQLRVSDLRRGVWCKFCKKTEKTGKPGKIKSELVDARHFKLEDVLMFTNTFECNFYFTSKIYRGSMYDHEWQCKKCKSMSTYKFHYIKNKQPKCLSCSKKASTRRLTKKEIEDFAKQKGGEFLSDTYKNNKTNYWWMCKAGHNFQLRVSDLRKGVWCKFCPKNEIQHINYVTMDDQGSYA